MGADVALNYRDQDWPAEIAKLTGKRGVDVILDMVAGDYVMKNVRSLALEGRLVQIAFLRESKIADFDAMPIMLKRLTLTGSTLRPRTVEQKGDRRRAGPRRLALFESASSGPISSSRLPLRATPCPARGSSTHRQDRISRCADNVKKRPPPGGGPGNPESRGMEAEEAEVSRPRAVRGPADFLSDRGADAGPRTSIEARSVRWPGPHPRDRGDRAPEEQVRKRFRIVSSSASCAGGTALRNPGSVPNGAPSGDGNWVGK
jgi:hypothetical protein